MSSFRKKIIKNEGFSLIEVVVTMFIVTLLVVAGIMAELTFKERSNITKAKADMAQIGKIAITAQTVSGKPLREFGNGCYALDSCLNNSYRTSASLPLDLRNIPTTDPCYIAVAGFFQSIINGTNGNYIYNPQMIRDPWGSPYILEPIAGCPKWFNGPPVCLYGGCYPEPPFPTCCQNDDLYSVGPDGRRDTKDDFSFGPSPRPVTSSGVNSADPFDDDLGGLVPHSYSGKCTYNTPDATHTSVWCEGY